jgi:hypothetical protein
VEPAPQAAPSEGGKLCNWCRAANPEDASVCIACGAAFPTPEGDEALDRAARARIDDMQEDIRKTRAATWWPFRRR